MNRWKQKHFYISTFKALPHSTGATLEDFRKIVRANREAGINLIENAIMSREEGLQAAEACELEQVPFLIQNITADKGFSGMGSNCPPVTTELVKELAEEQKERRYLEGYFLWDEMSTDNFPYCREVCDRFRQEVPDKLAYTLILPSYGAYWWDASGGDWQNSGYAQYVRDYIRVVDPDVISFDYYPFDVHGRAETDLRNCPFWRDMGLLRKEALKVDKPFWFYFQANDMGKGFTFTNQMRSVQMYAALAYGVKALSYFGSMSCVCDGNGTIMPDFEDIRALNTLVQNLGDFLFDKKSVAIYHYGIEEENRPLYYLDDETASPLIAAAPDNTIVGVFESNEGQSYLLVVNKNYRAPIEGTLSLKNARVTGIYDSQTDRMNVTNAALSVNLSIPAGDCVLLAVNQ